METSKVSDTYDSNEDEPPPLISDSSKPKLGNRNAQEEPDQGQILRSDEDEDEFDELEDGAEEVWWKAEGTNKCQDLFSAKTFFNAQQCLEYCRNIHGFNLKILKKRHSMDCFSFFRLVNYLRSQKPSPGLVMSLSSDALWQDDKYLKPVVEDDPLLMIDIEEDVYDSIEDDEDEEAYLQGSKQRSSSSRCDRSTHSNTSVVPESTSSSNAAFEVTPSSSSGIMDVASDEYENMKQQLIILRSKLEERNAEFETVLADMDHMKVVTRNLLLDSNEEAPMKNLTDGKPNVKSVGESRNEKEDSGYAGSYAHFGIHHEMLSDKVRTQSYKDAVSYNVKCLRDKLVLDLGCGTGILSMFCAKLGGARHVVGVDMSDIAHQAMDIVRENNLQDSITIVKGRLEDVNLSEKLKESCLTPTNINESIQFDVLISEVMVEFLYVLGMI